MINDGTRSFDHTTDGSAQILSSIYPFIYHYIPGRSVGGGEGAILSEEKFIAFFYVKQDKIPNFLRLRRLSTPVGQFLN